MESIIALHGLGGTKEVYLEVQNELASFNITAIDLPGHGKQPTLEYFTKESLIEWLTKYVKEPTSFIGYSISCHILIDFAYTYPHLVEKLIFIDGGYFSPKDFGQSIEEVIEQTKMFVDQSRVSSVEQVVLDEQKELGRFTEEIAESIRARYKIEKDGSGSLRIQPEVAAAYSEIFYEDDEKILCVPIFLITVTQPKELTNIRIAAIEKLKQKTPQLQQIEVEGSHEIIAEKPKEIARIIQTILCS
ncbi:alpha/beta hydrolase [Kurthia sp. FSL E2-0154]|uniref:alpha/beta hydrolase n=1 Tax=Kurthia sp. FSL E2-0154 TaxID=2921358 RepID=UPI0030FA1216